MILTSISIVSPNDFLAQLNSLIGLFMIFVNICAIVSYCRNAGNPYLNEKNKKKVRYFKLVIMIWNFAFITKFVFSSAGVTLLDIDKQTGA